MKPQAAASLQSASIGLSLENTQEESDGRANQLRYFGAWKDTLMVTHVLIGDAWPTLPAEITPKRRCRSVLVMSDSEVTTRGNIIQPSDVLCKCVDARQEKVGRRAPTRPSL